MAFFSAFADFLTGPVGNGLQNTPKDIRNTKRNLSRSGFFNDETENDFITAEMEKSIRHFQRARGLKEDGKLLPGGETEREIFKTLERRDPGPFLGHAVDGGGYVGFGGNVSGTLERKPRHHGQSAFSPSAFTGRKLDIGLLGSAGNNQRAQANSRPVEFDATGRMRRDNVLPIPRRKPAIPDRKSETIAPTSKIDEILDFVGKIESSDNYNVIVGGKEEPLTQMTIREVRQLQRKRKAQNLGTAVGRYQIVIERLDDLIRWMDLDEDIIFDENLQDQMGRELLRRRKFEEYKAGKITTKQFIGKLAKEWAALPKDESNKSHYDGVGNNKALTDFKTLKNLLEKN